MMWPYEVDLSVVAACISSLVAAGVLGWTVWWSYERSRREALANIATARLSWIESVRDTSSDLLSLSAALLLDEELDKQTFTKLQKVGFHIGLLLEQKPTHQRVAQLIVRHHEYVTGFMTGQLERRQDSPFFDLEADLQTELQNLLAEEKSQAEAELRGCAA